LGEFLGHFTIRKVAAGDELLRVAGRVTKKLAGWLGERGYLKVSGTRSEARRDATSPATPPDPLWRQ
jgi:hypothetical protein